jgi:hypothetical protein
MTGRATILYVDSKKLPKTFTTKEIFDHFVALDLETITGIILDAIINRYDNRIQIVQTALKVGFNINQIINMACLSVTSVLSHQLVGYRTI